MERLRELFIAIVISSCLAVQFADGKQSCTVTAIRQLETSSYGKVRLTISAKAH